LDRKQKQLNLGPAYCLLLERQMYRDKSLKGQLQRPADLDIVLCTTRATKQYTENILEYLGIDDFVVLGRHLEAWKHIYKLELIVDYIKNNPQPELLLHLDAPDVLVIGDLQAAVDHFHSDFDCDLLFGAEKNSAPGSKTTGGIMPSEVRFLSRIETFEEASYQAPFQYLNAGCFIGRKEYILDVFSEALRTRKQMNLSSRLGYGDYMYNDDQLVLRELHRKHYPRIQLDHRNRIFQNLYATTKSEISAKHPVPGGIRFLVAYLRYLMFIVMHKIKRRFVNRKRPAV
jgi:hypothetical protein